MSYFVDTSATGMGTPFSDVARSIMDEYLSWSPSHATQVGWHAYDHLLEDVSTGSLARCAKRCSELAAKLGAIPNESLSEDERIDRDLGILLLRLKEYQIEHLRLHEKRADAANSIGHSLFFLFIRDVPPFENRMESVMGRIERIPKLLADSRAGLKNPFRMWNEAQLEIGLEIPSLLREIEATALKQMRSEEHKLRMRTAVARGIAAVEEYNRWLRDDVIPRSEDECTITSDEYDRLMELQGFGITTQEATRVFEAHLTLTRKRISDVAKRVVSSGNLDEAFERMKSAHPASFGAALKEYRESAWRAREFLLQHDFLTIPEGEKLVVIETPRFMRPMFAFAAQYEPGKFDGSRTGLYLVTPDESNPGLLREHNHAGVQNTTVHEGYPGHHLQGICANENSSFIRTLMMSPDYGEGWALYTEDFMISNGYNDNPLGKLANMSDLLFRIVRGIIDMKLSRGEMSLKEGGEFLSRECRMDPKASMQEARACAMGPTYYVSYFLGKLGILQLKEDVRRVMGERFTDKFFHDSLLYSGCMPMPLMRRAVAKELRDMYGLELGPPRESLYEYGMRTSKG
ncbi:MAG: DUF885 domain-containing protein [Thermoplasmata archaeon]|jgi:uncharacterized protein (DUF885 family)|nr:DUF885 domain-containing protein [Thermoplasmata archaeon]